MPHDIFISYSRRDLAAVKPIKEDLESMGFSCWMDLEGIESGVENFKRKIVPALDRCKIVLFFISSDSQKSEWTAKELGYAKRHGKRVVPLRVNDDLLVGEFDFDYGNANIVDWRKPEQRDKFILDLRRWNGAAAAAVSPDGQTTPEPDAPVPPTVPEPPSPPSVPAGNAKRSPLGRIGRVAVPAAVDVFISYRRSTGADAARTLQQALKARGYRVFFDYDSIRDGAFDEEIYRAIDNAGAVVLLLSEGALDRCANEGDWVRLELVRALERKRKIALIAPSNQTWSFPVDLPPELALLRDIQVSELHMGSLFDESVEQFVDRRLPLPQWAAKAGTPATAVRLLKDQSWTKAFELLGALRKKKPFPKDADLVATVVEAVGVLRKDGTPEAQRFAAEGLEWLRAAAAAGRPRAQYELGCLPLGSDDAEAAMFFHLGALNGDLRAMCRFGDCLRLGTAGRTPDPAGAARWYDAAAERGLPHAMYRLGRLCEENGPAGADKAVRLYRRAVKKDHVPSMRRLGVCLLCGRGAPKDEELGATWLRKAAEKGDAEAQYRFGLCLENGIGVPKDVEWAYETWFHKAAEKGFLPAMVRKGLYDLFLAPNRRREIVGFVCLEEAAMRNDPEACAAVGYCYEQGVATPADPELAKQWFGRCTDPAKGFSTLARYLARVGRTEQAEAYARRAEARPDSKQGAE